MDLLHLEHQKLDDEDFFFRNHGLDISFPQPIGEQAFIRVLRIRILILNCSLPDKRLQRQAFHSTYSLKSSTEGTAISTIHNEESPDVLGQSAREKNDVLNDDNETRRDLGAPSGGSTPEEDVIVTKEEPIEGDRAGQELHHTTTQDTENLSYPEGGKQAWLVVFGTWCAMVCGFGISNTVGTIQAYVSTHQLKDYSISTVAWIFSIYIFLIFFFGLQIGPIFDKYGPRILILIGSIFQIASLLLIGISTDFWHFILSFSILGGLGSSLLFTPSITAIGHWFNERRGFATGVATTGGAVGGIIFPLTLQALFPRVGWAWATRVLALIFFVLCSFACLLVRSRLPPKRGATVIPSFRIFLDGTGAMAFTTMGIFFLEWALFLPLSFLTQYALSRGVDSSFSYQIMAIFNAGSVIGRYVPGYAADRWGRYNTMLATVAGCIISVLAFWLSSAFTPQDTVVPLLITFSLLMGFSSGSNISLTPICVGQLCDTREYGRYYATCYTLVSFGSLTGLPIGGALVNTHGGGWWALILFTGLSYICGFLSFAAAKIGKCGWNMKAIF